MTQTTADQLRYTRRFLRWLSLGIVLAGVAISGFILARGFDTRGYSHDQVLDCPPPGAVWGTPLSGCEDEGQVRAQFGFAWLVASIGITAALLAISGLSREWLGRLLRWCGVGLALAVGATIVFIFACLPYKTTFDVDGTIECPPPITWGTDAEYVEGDVTNGIADQEETNARCADGRNQRLLYSIPGLLIVGAAAAMTEVGRRRRKRVGQSTVTKR